MEGRIVRDENRMRDKFLKELLFQPRIELLHSRISFNEHRSLQALATFPCYQARSWSTISGDFPDDQSPSTSPAIEEMRPRLNPTFFEMDEVG